MHPVLSLERFLDRLICGEVRELDEGADAVEDLEGGDHFLGVADWDVGGREGGVDSEAGADEARRHGFREVGGDALGGGAEWGGELGDFKEDFGGFVEVVGRDGLGALEEEGEEM